MANELYLFTAFIPSAAKLLIMYPLVWAILNAIVCAPHGSLHPLTIQCTCPSSRGGRACEECLITDPNRGTCLQRTRVCKGKWMGTLCDYCPALNVTADCDAPCDNARGGYDASDTDRCRNCTRELHCSGHGTCANKNPTGMCECDKGYTSPEISFSGYECSLRCPNNCGGPDKTRLPSQ